jgi:hypothetical protein
MKNSNNKWLVPPHVLVLSALALVIVTISPVAATLTLSSVAFTPNPPMEPGQVYDASANIVIVPSGATTFATGHEIQLLTSFTNAQWNIQVYVNGRAAAHQTATGSVAFVNGELLSYGSGNDVSLRVDVSGTVPANAGPSLMVMQAQELNNNGSPVPGSVVTVYQPTTVPTVTAYSPTPSSTSSIMPTPLPAKTSSPSPSPTKAPGFTLTGTLGALCVVSVIAVHGFRKSRGT